MIVFSVNCVPYGSTGRIMFQLADMVDATGGISYSSAPFVKHREIVFPDNFHQIGTAFGKLFHMKMAQRNGRHGSYSKWATLVLIHKIRKANPDIIHLHNIHGWFLNYEIFFDFLAKYDKPVIWTLHDCWSFTGHCPHFTYVKCDKWKTGCCNCPIYDLYPQSRIDNSERMYNLKKRLFTSLPKLTIVTPSSWLAECVDKSFLHAASVRVINNGIDLDVFKRRESSFREDNDLVGKFIVLGVAFNVTERKGLDTFNYIAEKMDDNCKLVLVGVEENSELISDRALKIPFVASPENLSEIYSASDVFINPTLEDSFPTVNLEALACGTPVVTYRTGGSPEAIDEDTGVVVDYNDKVGMLKTINNIKSGEVSFSPDKCCERAKRFGLDNMNEQYLALYEEVLDK